MRLVIDCRMMGAGNTRGIGRYIEETLSAMKPLLPKDWEVVELDAPVRWYTFAEQTKWLTVIKQSKPDLLWVPHWNVPLLYRGPLAITVHDLLLLHQSASAKASTRNPLVALFKKIGHRLVLSRAMRQARVIFVPTHAVADDVAAFFPSAKSKILVTGEGLTALPAPIEPKTSEALTGKKFLLYVGSSYPHKRVDLLLEAWKVIQKTHPEFHLVITGEHDVFLQRLLNLVRTQSIPRVIFPGRVTNAEIAWLFAQAELFVFPSSFEGMGLPPIEALSAGLPVVCSDIPVLKEVVPDQGVLFFRNGDKNDMIRAIEQALTNPDQLRRDAVAGGEQARLRHAWKDTARLTLEGLEKACRVPNG